MNETLQIRVHGGPDRPTLIYLPGLHGDWTLVGSFRRAVEGRVRFVEMTYPRTLTWSLDDYAAQIEASLVREGVMGGWLLAESFGSQIAWPLAARGQVRVEGLILAGGFGRHPTLWGVRIAERLTGRASPTLLSRLVHMYASLARMRYRYAREVLSGMKEFVARRTDLDRQAIQHRLKLILHNDPCELAAKVSAPVFALTGLADPIVPWWPVRRWLKRHCHTIRDQRIIWRADHAVLMTAPQRAAEQVLKWVGTSGSGH